ncbi:MAG: DinB family protein [Reichenbachiella sp.]
MKRQELLSSLMAMTNQIKKEVEEMAELDKELLLKRPEKESWSALECIEHLNIADAHYLTEFDKRFTNGPESNEEEFRTGWLGNYFVKSIAPREDGTIPSPMKTMKKFKPVIRIHHDTVSKFLEDQDELLAVLKQCETLDLHKIKIPSAIGRIVTFKLGDALRFLIGHNLRHIIQAKKALERVKSELQVVE